MIENRTDIYLSRFLKSSNTTVGQLILDSVVLCYTIERAWLNNQRRVSCIPEGSYRLRIRDTENRGRHLLVEGVKDRSLILLHSGNTYKDSMGCILPNTGIILSSNEPKGTESKLAVSLLNNKIFTLIDNGVNVYLHITTNL